MSVDRSLDKLIELALEEDLGAAGDVTSKATVPASDLGTGELWAKERMVLSGLGAFARVFELVDATTRVKLLAKDGDRISGKAKVATVEGPMRSLLAAERTALNIVQRTSGIATASAKVAQGLKGKKLRVLDTRKTAPGMRALSKAAVRDGGLTSHRFGLFDGILIKDNHVAAVGGSVGDAIRRARAHAGRLLRIEAEITRLDQLEEAIAAGADVVMLDNMTLPQVKRAVKLAAGRVELEMSGGVTAEKIPAIAATGVDFVSMGALTHSAPAVDLSLELAAVTAKKAAAASATH